MIKKINLLLQTIPTQIHRIFSDEVIYISKLKNINTKIKYLGSNQLIDYLALNIFMAILENMVLLNQESPVSLQ